MRKRGYSQMCHPPLVSVCIGVFNRERYIRECLDSVLAQTYKNIEIVVVDDASTDNTVDIVKSYGDRVRLIERSINSGVCGIPRNDAISHASGEYLAFLDSDDAWHEEKLAVQIAYFAKHPDVDWIHTYALIMDDESRKIAIRHEGSIDDVGVEFERLLAHCYITISSVIVKTSSMERSGYFTADKQFRGREDYELFLRLARSYRLGFISQPLTYYRKAESGLSHADSFWHSMPRDVVALQLVFNEPSYWDEQVSMSRIRQLLNQAYMENALHWRYQKKLLRSAWFLLHALRLSPFDRLTWTECVKVLVYSLEALFARLVAAKNRLAVTKT